MDWSDLDTPATLERLVARELHRGAQPGRLRVRLGGMGVDPEVARAVILRVIDEGAEVVLARHRGPDRKSRKIALAMMVGGVAAITYAATWVDQDVVRWWVFAITGGGLLTAVWGLARWTR